MGGRWINKYVAIVKWYWKGKTEIFRDKYYADLVVVEVMSI
jgi:hypothetical protein